MPKLKISHILGTGRPTNFKLGTRMEYDEPHHRRAVTSKLKAAGDCLSHHLQGAGVYIVSAPLQAGQFVVVVVVIVIDGQHVLAVICFYIKIGFWSSYCHISTDLDNILHTPIVVRNALVGRLRLRSARGRLQAKQKRLCFL